MCGKFVVWIVLAALLFKLNECLAQNNSAQEPKIYSEVSGYFGIDYRYFPDRALYPGQHKSYFSMLFQPEVYLEWNKGKQLLQFVGFARIDQYDTKRTHADIRELYWQAIFKNWELSVGLKKIFWGITESNHLVDIINQADALEGFDLEKKLGQPMIHFSWSSKWGIIDLLAMTYHRQLKFPGTQGRLRPPFDLDNDNTSYEGELEEYNPDLAIRWSHSISIFDIGLSHFYGSSRTPLFATLDSITFSAFYELINQTGLDIQASTGSMLWKTEIIYRVSKRKNINAVTVGGEYTFSNIFSSGIDIGLIAEYNFDDRGAESINALNDDFFFGTRLAINDKQSSDLIGGVIIDRENQTLRYLLEVNRRLGDSWKISIEASGFSNIDPSEFLYLIRNDSYAQISLAKYF
ncbi:MAG: hypothetical protein O6848_04255 [Bacteroidetes bacterium]|nr:hypothetical protein [Bacteroidota bacterium]